MSVVWWILLYFGASCFSVTVSIRQIPQKVYVGDDVKLHCNFDLDDDTVQVIRWFKNRQMFYIYYANDTPPYRHFPVTGVDMDVERSRFGMIYLKDVDKKSEGSYGCNVITFPPFRIINKERMLTVKDITTLSLSRRGVEVPQEVYAGDDVKLRCKFDQKGDSLNTIDWYKDHRRFFRYMVNILPGRIYFPGAGVNMDIARSGSDTIYLKEVDKESEGFYKCEISTIRQAENIYGRGTLTIKESPMLSQISLEIPQKVYVGDDVKLRCNFDLEDDTLQAIQWFKNGQMFSLYNASNTPTYQYFSVTGVNMDVERSGNGTIYLKDVDKKSEGSYRCNIITFPPSKIIYKEEMLTVKDIPLLSLPQIGFEDPLVVYDGDDVKLRCNLDLEGYGIASIQWFKDNPQFSLIIGNNNPIYVYMEMPGVNVDFERSGNDTIYLKDVDMESEGLYKCAIYTMRHKGIYGQRILTVKESPMLAHPMIDLKLPHEVHVDDDVNLTCNFNLEDEPLYSVNWYKDNQEFYSYAPSDTPPYEFNPVKGVYLDVERSGNDTIYLKDVDKESEGTYMCNIATYPPFRMYGSEGRMLTVKDIAKPRSGSMQLSYHSISANILLLIVLWIM